MMHLRRQRQSEVVDMKRVELRLIDGEWEISYRNIGLSFELGEIFLGIPHKYFCYVFYCHKEDDMLSIDSAEYIDKDNEWQVMTYDEFEDLLDEAMPEIGFNPWEFIVNNIED